MKEKKEGRGEGTKRRKGREGREKGRKRVREGKKKLKKKKLTHEKAPDPNVFRGTKYSKNE